MPNQALSKASRDRKSGASRQEAQAAKELERLASSAAAAARLMKALASEQRLRLLCQLGAGECSVNTLASGADIAQATASQHLARLRAEGMVATRRAGQTVFYRLADPAASRVIATLCEIFGGPAAKKFANAQR